MTCYIVSFEVSSESTRQQVRERLKTFNGYCPINKTCWAITTDKKSSEIRDSLGEVIGQTDRIFVIRSGTEASWRNAFGDEHSAWLKKNL